MRKAIRFGVMLPIISGCAQAMASVYQCQGLDGSLNYSDRPCDGVGQAYHVQTPIYEWQLKAPKGLSVQSKRSKQNKREKAKSVCRRFSATELRNLRVKDTLVKGMPEAHLEKRFGRDRKTVTTGPDTQKWVYKSDRVTRILNIKGGCLATWKESWHGEKSAISKYH